MDERKEIKVKKVLNREETILQYNLFMQKTVGKSKFYKLRDVANSWSDERLAMFVRKWGFEPIYK